MANTRATMRTGESPVQREDLREGGPVLENQNQRCVSALRSGVMAYAPTHSWSSLELNNVEDNDPSIEGTDTQLTDPLIPERMSNQTEEFKADASVSYAQRATQNAMQENDPMWQLKKKTRLKMRSMEQRIFDIQNGATRANTKKGATGGTAGKMASIGAFLKGGAVEIGGALKNQGNVIEDSGTPGSGGGAVSATDLHGHSAVTLGNAHEFTPQKLDAGLLNRSNAGANISILCLSSTQKMNFSRFPGRSDLRRMTSDMTKINNNMQEWENGADLSVMAISSPNFLSRDSADSKKVTSIFGIDKEFVEVNYVYRWMKEMLAKTGSYEKWHALTEVTVSVLNPGGVVEWRGVEEELSTTNYS